MILVGISPCGAHYYFGHERPVKVQLHVFSNASKDANAAVIYVCSDYAEWSITVILVASKTKIASIIQLLIPHMDLLQT